MTGASVLKEQFGGRRGGRGGFRLSLIAAGLVLAALIAVPATAMAATAHADADDPLHLDPDCGACHKPHTAPTKRSLLADVDESEVCYVCHGEPAGSDWNVETWTANSFDISMQSGHSLEDETDPDATVDLTNSCTGCHGVHGDPDLRANLPANEQVAGATIDPADPKTWCLACHNAEHAWYAGSETSGVFTVDAGLTAAYEALIQDPTRTAAYYPSEGTFPGSTGDTAYLTSTHAAGIDAATVQSLVSVPTETVNRVQGDCLWCHASHRSTAASDGLLGEYRASTADDAVGGATAGQYAQACFECHGRSSGTVYLPSATYTDTYWETTVGAPNIYKLVVDSTNPDRRGHQIKSSGAFYPVDSPLPCYECHNPHGSKNGNAVMISDALGSNLNPRGTGEEVRAFCFSCHTTGDTTAGWDSDTSAYVVISAGTKVIGIDRTFSPTDPTPGWLQLSDKSYHGEANGTSCLACHDSTHSPGPGVSKGGKDCYLCHGTYMDYMEDGTDRDTSDTEAGVGTASRLGVYHHVMGSSTKDGDEAVNNATYTDTNNFTDYPAANTDVYCVSCHVDHDKFTIGNKSSSLRSTIGSTPTAPGGVFAASGDFNATNGGVCLGCHYLSRAKDTANQKSDSTSVTPVIPATPAGALADATTAYDNSPHQYVVAGRARSDATTFSGDCSKCHNDSIVGSFYGATTTSPDREFGLHYDSMRRILTALGRTAVDPYAEEQFCYRCHSPQSAGLKTTAGADWYGTAGIMPNPASENVYTQFTGAGYTAKHTLTLSNSAHKPASTDEVTSNRLSTAEHIECTDCHSPHAARNTTVSGTDRANPATATSNAIAATSPLTGVWGVQPPVTAAWSEPTPTSYVISPDLVADYEYQICFKCHSGFNSSYAPATRTFSWGSATGWTNQAFEFNTANASYHPVMGVATRPVAAARMLAPWNTNVGNQTMYCSDCHMDNAASPLAQGPHGSANAWILRGTWNPTIDTIDSTIGSTTFLCRKCHVITDTHIAHQNSARHRNKPCADCHITVPHGGKIPRLIATTSMSGLDTRYSGGSVNMVSVNIPITGSSDCQVSGCGGSHSGSARTYAW